MSLLGLGKHRYDRLQYHWNAVAHAIVGEFLGGFELVVGAYSFDPVLYNYVDSILQREAKVSHGSSREIVGDRNLYL